MSDARDDKDGALKRLQDKLVAMGVRNVGFTWAPGAEKMTPDERAADVLKLFDAIERGAYETVFDSRTFTPSHVAEKGVYTDEDRPQCNPPPSAPSTIAENGEDFDEWFEQQDELFLETQDKAFARQIWDAATSAASMPSAAKTP